MLLQQKDWPRIGLTQDWPKITIPICSQEHLFIQRPQTIVSSGIIRSLPLAVEIEKTRIYLLLIRSSSIRLIRMKIPVTCVFTRKLLEKCQFLCWKKIERKSGFLVRSQNSQLDFRTVRVSNLESRANSQFERIGNMDR